MLARRYTGVCRMRYSALEQSASFSSRIVTGVVSPQVGCSLIPYTLSKPQLGLPRISLCRLPRPLLRLLVHRGGRGCRCRCRRHRERGPLLLNRVSNCLPRETEVNVLVEPPLVRGLRTTAYRTVPEFLLDVFSFLRVGRDLLAMPSVPFPLPRTIIARCWRCIPRPGIIMSREGVIWPLFPFPISPPPLIWHGGTVRVRETRS